MKIVSGKRFCKDLESHGWVLKHIGSSHHTYKKAEFMKIAGLTDDDIS